MEIDVEIKEINEEVHVLQSYLITGVVVVKMIQQNVNLVTLTILNSIADEDYSLYFVQEVQNEMDVSSYNHSGQLLQQGGNVFI